MSSMDRLFNPLQGVQAVPVAARNASGATDARVRPGSGVAILTVYAASGTTGTLDVVVEAQTGNDQAWKTVAAFPTQTGPGGHCLTLAFPIDVQNVRYRYTIAGASFTFGVVEIL